MQYPPSGQNWPSQQRPPYGSGQPSQPLPSNSQWNSQTPSQPLPPYTQWGQQPYPPQQGQWQQPYGQPPPDSCWHPQQPPKKSRKGLWITLAVLAALIVFACIGVSAAIFAASKNAATTINNAESTLQPTTAPTQAAQTNTIGKPVQVGDTWVVTLNNVNTSTGGEVDVPSSGNTFLVVNVTLKNNSLRNQEASSLVMFSLKDSDGQTYHQAITFSGSPDGTVAAGGVIRGNIYYEVPTSNHDYILQFTLSIGSTGLAEWNVKI